MPALAPASRALRAATPAADASDGRCDDGFEAAPPAPPAAPLPSLHCVCLMSGMTSPLAPSPLSPCSARRCDAARLDALRLPEITCRSATAGPLPPRVAWLSAAVTLAEARCGRAVEENENDRGAGAAAVAVAVMVAAGAAGVGAFAAAASVELAGAWCGYTCRCGSDMASRGKVGGRLDHARVRSRSEGADTPRHASAAHCQQTPANSPSVDTIEATRLV